MYLISGGLVKVADRAWTSVNNEFQLNFSAKTVVEQTRVVDKKIPDRVYSFITMDNLCTAVGKLTDYIGIVTNVGDLMVN